MKEKKITLFMWGYQPHYRFQLEYDINQVMKELGVPEAGAECLLVGAIIPGKQNPNAVCVEPEDDKWSLDLFDGLLDQIEIEIKQHPMQRMFYGDEPSMRDKPENIRRDSVRKAVQKALEPYDSCHSVRSFAGRPAPVEDYYVVPVLQLPIELFERFRPLREPVADGSVTGHASLIHAVVSEVMQDAHEELLRPDPGRHLFGHLDSKGIARRAATSFMYSPKVVIGHRSYRGPDLFEQFNAISTLMYEGTKSTGRLVLTDPGNSSINMHLRFAEPLPLSEARWCRKALQMAVSDTALVANCEKIFGLGSVTPSGDPRTSRDVFVIGFLDHCHWRLLHDGQVMLVSRYGFPSLPRDAFPRHRLLDTYRRLFSTATAQDINRFIALFEAAVGQRHGSLLIIAKDANAEASRLRGQGTRIDPSVLTPDLYHQVSGIDGAVIIDPHVVCHAIGVILDGPARPEGTASRGARYNSAIRYVGSSKVPRLAVIVSDDDTVDIIPVLMPKIKRSDLMEAIATIEAATSQNYHSTINWLDRHRFYLNREECDRVNAALQRIQEEPMEVGEIRREWGKFFPDPGFNDSYLEDETPGNDGSCHQR